MPIEILMPALSPTMTEGNLAKWKKKEGDKIKSGEVIAEIETDKATMEVEAVDEGTMGKIVVAEGTQGVKVNSVIALLLEEGEDKKVLEKYQVKGLGIGDSGLGKEKEAKPPTPISAVSSSQPVPSTLTPNHQSSIPTGSRIAASPLAKRVAQQEGMDLRGMRGTGPHGRIVRADVEEARHSGGGSGAVRRNPSETTAVPNNNIRKIVAKRLSESKQTVPHFYLTVECALDKLLDVRKDLNDAAQVRAGKDGAPAYKLSVNDFVIKASAMALCDVPAANASWSDEAILHFNNVDISVAVAIEAGLITPIVKNADQKSVITISAEMKDLAARARANKLAPEEFQGGGFSISNLGMYGIKNFAAIINPPQGCILAVGAGEERVIAHKGQMKVATMMDCTLSVDHRVVDGAVGAEFLAAFRRYVEAPSLLLV